MSIDSKLDKIIEELAVVKTISNQNKEDLATLRERLIPIFTHVIAMKTVMKLGSVVIAGLTCLAGYLLLLK